jgi:hypothetical protein
VRSRYTYINFCLRMMVRSRWFQRYVGSSITLL